MSARENAKERKRKSLASAQLVISERDKARERKRKSRAVAKGLQNTVPLQCSFVRPNGKRCRKFLASDAGNKRVRCENHCHEKGFAVDQTLADVDMVLSNTHVELKKSTVAGADMGVFASLLSFYREGDFITEYVVARTCETVEQLSEIEHRYAVHCPSTWGCNVLVGITEPTKGKEVGSFVNKAPPGRQPNCRMVLDSKSRKAYIQAVCDIIPGTELLLLHDQSVAAMVHDVLSM